MGGRLKEHKNKDMHIRLDYDLYMRFMAFLDSDKTLVKSEVIRQILDNFLKQYDF